MQVPFSVEAWTFWSATCLNVFFDRVIPVVGPGIRFLIRGIAKEMVAIELGRKPVGADDKKLVDAKQALLGGSKLFGTTIGIVERELYLYALVFQFFQILQGVIVFKGFSAWVQARSGETEYDRSHMLAHYYAYTLGNLFSIGWAIVLFQAAKASYPLVQTLFANF